MDSNRAPAQWALVRRAVILAANEYWWNARRPTGWGMDMDETEGNENIPEAAAHVQHSIKRAKEEKHLRSGGRESVATPSPYPSPS